MIADPRPCELGDALYIEFEGRQANDKDHEDGPVFQVVKDWLVVIGDKDTTPALEMGLRFMRDGETSLIYSDSKYAYGLTGRKQAQAEYDLPTNTNVLYRVRMKRLVAGDSNIFYTQNFQMEIARSKKIIGNDCYQFEWCDGHGKGKALQLYRKGSEAMVNLLTENDDANIQKEATAILVDCLNNVAAVYLKAKEYGKAKDAATKVILRDPDNMKGLLRAARAALYDPAGTFEESAAAIAAAEQVSPEDKDLRKLKIELGQKKREYKEKSKAMFSKMSNVIADPDQKTTVSSERPAEEQKKSPGDAMKPPTVGDSNKPEHSHGEENSSGEMMAPEKSGWRSYFPYVVQFLLPFLTYYLFKLMQRDSDARQAEVNEPAL